MSSGLDAFFDKITALAEALFDGVLQAHTALGVAGLLFLFLQVAFVLACLYIRRPATPKQWAGMLLILFAVVAICSMTVWLLLKAYSIE